MVFSSASFVLIISICLLIFSTNQDCPVASTELPQFFTRSISLSMMFNKSMLTRSGSQTRHYALNIPNQLLYPAYWKTTNGLLSLNTMEIDGFTNLLRYRSRLIKSQTTFLIIFQTYQAKWKDLSLTVLVFSHFKYQFLFLDQVFASNSQSRLSLSLQKKLPLQIKSATTTRVLTFLTGISIDRKNELQYYYELKIVDKIDVAKNSVVITVRAGDNNRLNEIYLSYFLISSDNSNSKQYQIWAEYFNVGGFGLGVSQRFWAQGAGFYENSILGLSGFKFKKGPGSFEFSFGPSATSQSSVSFSSNLLLTSLKISIFVASAPLSKQCSSCPQASIGFNKGQKTSCVSSCSEGSLVANPSGVNQCLICNMELGYGQIGGVCACLGGLIQTAGRCVGSNRNISDVTFSVSTSDCIDPNSVPSPDGSCKCRPGFSQKVFFNQIQCTSICSENSYFDGQTCITCPPGTFPVTELRICTECTSNCQQCRTEFACQQCVMGFKVNQTNQCQQICGDGILVHISQNSCDDGNNEDGDGCSAQCQVENGWRCKQQGRSICTKQSYSIVRQTNLLKKGGVYLLQYRIRPPYTTLLSSAQAQDIMRVVFSSSPPYQTYITHNPLDLQVFRVVCIYGGNTPLVPAQIQTWIKLPNGEYFHETFTQVIQSSEIRLYSRSLNRDSKDKLS